MCHKKKIVSLPPKPMPNSAARLDKRKRFSEELADKELKENMRLKKLYRQLQRQVHSEEELRGKVRSISLHQRWVKETKGRMMRVSIYPLKFCLVKRTKTGSFFSFF